MKILRYHHEIVYVPDEITTSTSLTSDADLLISNITDDPYPNIQSFRTDIEITKVLRSNDTGDILKYNGETLEKDNKLVILPPMTLVTHHENSSDKYHIGYTDRKYKLDPFCIEGMFRSTYSYIDPTRMVITSWEETPHTCPSSKIGLLLKGPIHVYYIYKKDLIDYIIPVTKYRDIDKIIIDAYTYGPLEFPICEYKEDAIITILGTKPLLRISNKSSYQDIHIISSS